MKKHIVSFVLAGTLLYTSLVPTLAFADQFPNVTVMIDGQYQSFQESPVIIDDRTFVPVQDIASALAAETQWNPQDETVTVTNDGTSLQLQIGSSIAKWNGQSIDMGVEPQILHGHMMVPVSTICQALGATVQWNESKKTVDIFSDPNVDLGNGVSLLKKSILTDTPLQIIYYPELSGLSDPSVQSQINSILKKQAVINSLSDVVEYRSNYRIQFHRGNILNLVFHSYLYTGGAHGLPTKTSLIINLSSGAVYSLSDLFKPNSDYIGKLSDMIKQQDTNHILDSFSPFQSISKDERFYLESDGLTIYFPPYKYTPYAYGFPKFKISYQDVMDFINTESPIWKAISQ
ncbi:DUF3298 domain-containing protein [Fodinisporobacter ferrooxydans]|uniref:DUF3298 domain-containing protein n=1 Tax=Fodinisporobacter ferrooxydans TaxID=2901836 RepID=A0ABY4CLW5_9BACL|nr:DUF3298 domain-containing protein [Alicyclobacillaceae bacterium MYW30-H2]